MNKYIVYLFLISLFQPVMAAPNREFGTIAPAAQNVAFMRLIANPEIFINTTIRTHGYLAVVEGRSMLVSSYDSTKNIDSFSTIDLVVGNELKSELPPLSRMHGLFAMIEGFFEAKPLEIRGDSYRTLTVNRIYILDTDWFGRFPTINWEYFVGFWSVAELKFASQEVESVSRVFMDTWVGKNVYELRKFIIERSKYALLRPMVIVGNNNDHYVALSFIGSESIMTFGVIFSIEEDVITSARFYETETSDNIHLDVILGNDARLRRFKWSQSDYNIFINELENGTFLLP